MDGVELIVRDHSMSIGKTRPEVIGFQFRVVREDSLRSLPLSKQTENEFDRDTHPPNDGLATKDFGVHCYASKNGLVDHGYWLFAVRCNEHFVRQDIVDSKSAERHASNGVSARSLAYQSRAVRRVL